MRISTWAMPLCLAAVIIASTTPVASAALTLKLNPDDLAKQGPGPLAADVGVLINWDGSGTNLISGINFDVTVPPSVTLSSSVTNPLGFTLANADPTTGSVAFASLSGNVAPLVNGDTLLTTFRFNVNAAAGTFPIGLRLVSAEQGSLQDGSFADITNQVTATGGTLNVSAVPEPSSLALLGLIAGSCGWRRRRSSF